MRAAEERAHELLDEGRVWLVPDPPGAGAVLRSVALVAGRSRFYRVTADNRGVFCTCPVSGRICSHRLAAMVAWAEQARDAATEAAA